MTDDATPLEAESPLPQRRLQDTSRTRREWSVFGLCTATDPEIFFRLGDGQANQAREICTRCPVRAQCLSYAVAADEPYGIWGGLDTDERRLLRRRLKRRDLPSATAWEFTP